MKLDFSNCIVTYLHCGRCLQDKPAGVSPREWADLEAGWTERGFQLWCKRHNCNVVHVDFEGKRHPAVTTAMIPKPHK